MNPAMTNSTNSVSTTKKKREAERSVNWTVEETQVLLCAWSDERVQKSLTENLRNRHVFKHLSARMSEMGFARSPHQCRLRVKTLKANYARAKLQRSVDSAQPCSFKYFAEMDAVLGRRSHGDQGGPYFVSPERITERHLDSMERTGSLLPEFSSNREPGGNQFGPLGRTGRPCLSSFEERGADPHSDVKLEDEDDSTDDFEFSDAGFQQHPRDRRSDVYLESSIHGTAGENTLTTPSPQTVPRPPPPPPAQTTPSPPLHPSPSVLHHHPDSSCLEPVLKHLSDCFQQLVSETRSLLVQLESQRQEQARWHQELLAQWLQREERRQREVAEREERREKARMEHEIRVLQLLTGLAREQGCKCGGSQNAVEAPTGPNHTISKGGN
ncbi:uncharacterized protein LOC114862377 [Betta splendens]|uniref:Uncharacterized protein LOC114862377 n=1 Tax=Betta splendens TaxID=158456 RepID=A0A6P7NJZ0_BETSP|nr:uncharacterized protein LOC114862377 [Betta splendens]